LAPFFSGLVQGILRDQTRVAFGGRQLSYVTGGDFDDDKVISTVVACFWLVAAY